MPHSHLHRLIYSLATLMLLTGMQPGEWSMTDQTTVDLEREKSVTATQYHHPRGARHYRYDETEVDLAIPMPAPTPGAPHAVPTPAPDDTPETILTPEEELPQ